MKRIIYIILLFSVAVILSSCTKTESKREYRAGSDGLFYEQGSDKLYTGYVIDTSDVIVTFEVVNGVKNGAFITFYTNGEYEKYGLIVNDKNTGTWRYFYSDGQLESIGSFQDNKPEGKWVSYYPNGRMKTEGEYIEGEQHGWWKYYNEEGELINVYIFGNGMLLEDQIKS